jgi:hypothetical protein
VRWLGAALCAAALFAFVAGCGSDERTLTAEDLVAELEENGLSLDLGETLTTDREDVELYAIQLSGGGAGTLAIAEDADAALAEYERCESSASLFCFRAANAVLVFDSEVPNQDLARVAAAVEALAED